MLAGDPGSGTALHSAVEWVCGVLLGTTATVVATLAIAGVGYLLLMGRLPIQRGASVILGCFILFSARQVASGLLAASAGGAEPAFPSTAQAPGYATPAVSLEGYDPYSGAAVPQ